MFHKKLWFLLLLSCLGMGLACGSLFKKKKKGSSSDSLDERFPSDWDLTSDWGGGSWKVKDL